MELRNLVVVLGDQLHRDSAAFDGFYCDQDAVWMAEVGEESTHVWSHKARITIFLSAMRHFRDSLRQAGTAVHYRQIDGQGAAGALSEELSRFLDEYRPERVVLAQPGEWRVRQALERTAAETGVALEIRPDRHFLSSIEKFRRYAEGKERLLMEYFYRELRQKHGVLMEPDGQPVGGEWNYDKQNRGSFSKEGPGALPAPVSFPPDRITREVLDTVERLFPDHPGSLEHFDWAVTPEDAQRALDDFIEHRLPDFGDYQDAMWTKQPYLYHSRLSSALNLKLIDPLRVIRQAQLAYERGHAPLAAAEGFIRQILGWREYIRGLYWMLMPGYLAENALEAHEDLPAFYWNGKVPMRCLRE